MEKIHLTTPDLRSFISHYSGTAFTAVTQAVTLNVNESTADASRGVWHARRASSTLVKPAPTAVPLEVCVATKYQPLLHSPYRRMMISFTSFQETTNQIRTLSPTSRNFDRPSPACTAIQPLGRWALSSASKSLNRDPSKAFHTPSEIPSSTRAD